MSRRQITYSDLTGGINNVDTKERLNSTPKRTETPDMVNVEYFGLGGIKSMEGNMQIGNKQSSSIVGGWEYVKGNDRHMMIATKDGSVKRYNNTTEKFDEIYKFDHQSDRVSFCNMNNGVIATNGIDDLVFYEYGRNTKLTGTITLTPIEELDNEFSNIITGSGEGFGSDFRIGDYIKIDNSLLSYKVNEINLVDNEVTLDKNVIINDGRQYLGWSGFETEATISTTGNVTCVPTGNIFRNYASEESYTFAKRGNGINNLSTWDGAIINGYKYNPQSNNISNTGNYETLYTETTDGYSYYTSGIAIKDGSLYIVIEGSESLIDDTGDWTELFENFPGSEYTYGIRDGELRVIKYDFSSYTTTLLPTSLGSGWTSVSGSSGVDYYSQTFYAYGIQNGKLYLLSGTSKTQIGSYTDWSKVSGWYSNYSSEVVNAIAYRSNGLYVIDRNGNTNTLLYINDSIGVNKFNSRFCYYTINNASTELMVSDLHTVYRILKDRNTGECFLNQLYVIGDENILDIVGENNKGIIVTDNNIYRYYNGNLTKIINNYSYWVLNNNEVNINNYNISATNELSEDTITLNINSYNNNEYTITMDNNCDAVYSSAEESSEIDSATNISIVNAILSFNNNDIVDNNTIYRYGEYSRNNELDEINEEEISPYVDIDFHISDISELNAYIINTNPEASEQDLHQPVRGLAIQYYAGRLWVGGDDGLFYSAVGQPGNWDKYSDAGRFDTLYNDSSGVKALGIWSEFLMVHKEFSTYLLSCTGNSESIEVKPYSNITCESQQSWIVSNTKYFVFSKDFLDIYPLVQRTVFSDKFLGEPVSQNIRNIFKQLRIEETEKIFCVSRPRERQMLFYLPMDNTVGSSTAVIFDFQTKSWLKRVVPQDVTIAFNFDNNIYIGTSDGLVLVEFVGQNFNGEPIVSYYKSPWFDWTDGYTQSFAEFMIEIDAGHLNNFYIRTQKDGQSRYEDRIINSDILSKRALTWSGNTESLYNNTKWDVNQWASGTFENLRMLLPNNVFEDFQLEIGTNQLGQGFSIYCYAFRRIEAEEAPW